MQVNQVDIGRVLPYAFFNFGAHFVYRAKSGLIEGYCPCDYLINKAHFFLGTEILDALVDKVVEYGRFHRANRDDGGLGNQNTERNCSVAVLVMSDLDRRNVNQNKGISVL